MLRPLGLACLSVSLVTALGACASILGDFDVSPVSATTPDGATPDGSGGTDGGSDSGPGGPAGPTGLVVAASLDATCATVEYPSKKKYTYCWGAQGLGKDATLGVGANEPGQNFFRPRLASTTLTQIAFDTLYSSGTGSWFAGAGFDPVQGSTLMYAWGANESGQAAKPPNMGEIVPPKTTLPNILKVGGGNAPLGAVTGGTAHACLVANSPASVDPAAYCWGRNDFCQVTSGLQIGCQANDKIASLTDVTTTLGADKRIERLAGGLEHACVWRKAGAAKSDILCWGSNVSGATGQPDAPSNQFVDQPKLVVEGSVVADLAAGEKHTCALLAARIICWGRNAERQVSDQDGDAVFGPTTLTLPASAPAPAAITSLSLGANLSCFIGRASDTIVRAYCFGGGAKGRASTDREHVGAVAGIEDVTQIAVGKLHTCAIAKTAGAPDEAPGVWCWGTNVNKQVDPTSADQLIELPRRIVFPAEPK